jgi:four helix bundle protein
MLLVFPIPDFLSPIPFYDHFGLPTMSIQSYRDLLAWQKAMDLAAECHQLTLRMPKSEQFGLSSQIQRSATNMPSEIANGHGRSTTRDFLWHLGNANGLRCQLETQLILAQRAGHIPTDELARLLDRSAEVGRILTGLIPSLERKLD